MCFMADGAKVHMLRHTKSSSTLKKGVSISRIVRISSWAIPLSGVCLA